MIMLGLMEQNREMGIGGVGAVKGGGDTWWFTRPSHKLAGNKCTWILYYSCHNRLPFEL